MDSLKRAIRFQFMETKEFTIGFWATVILVDILFYILNYISIINGSVDITIGFSLGSSQLNNLVSVMGINLMIVAISFLIYNYQRNYESFPLSLSLGMTRKDYFTSFLISDVSIAFVFATIQAFLLKIDPFFIEMIGREPLYDFINFNTKTDNVFYIIFSLFILFLSFISFWNLLSSLNYRFGYRIWIFIFVINVLFTITKVNILGNIIENILTAVSDLIVGRIGVFESILLFLGMILLYTLNYFATITSDINKKTI